MNTLFKVLAEVKLFHEYYLTEETGKTIFEYASQQEKNEFLSRSFEANRPTIASDIAFETVPDSADLFTNHKLRLVPSYSGFKILAQVTANVLTNNSVSYTPAIPLPSEIIIGLRRKNPGMDAYTNSRIIKALPSIFYFSNTGEAASQDFPTLSSKVPAHSVLTSYEQGELSLNPTGQVQSYSLNDNGNEEWITVPGSSYANEQDRIVVEPKFEYTFPSFAHVTLATFRLLDANGLEIKVITFENIDGIRKVTLDMRAAASLTQSRSGLSSNYTLEVSGNDFRQVHTIMFFDSDVDLRSYWGIVHLAPRARDERFSLIDDENHIRVRKNPDGTNSTPEYFEIRVKSRPTFWRYVNQQGKKIKANPTLDDFLKYDAARGTMTSLTMRSAAYTPTDFTGNGNTKFLPHPMSFDPVTIENGRIITQINVSRSDLFDI